MAGSTPSGGVPPGTKADYKDPQSTQILSNSSFIQISLVRLILSLCQHLRAAVRARGKRC